MTPNQKEFSQPCIENLMKRASVEVFEQTLGIDRLQASSVFPRQLFFFICNPKSFTVTKKRMHACPFFNIPETPPSRCSYIAADPDYNKNAPVHRSMCFSTKLGTTRKWPPLRLVSWEYWGRKSLSSLVLHPVTPSWGYTMGIPNIGSCLINGYLWIFTPKHHPPWWGCEITAQTFWEWPVVSNVDRAEMHMVKRIRSLLRVWPFSFPSPDGALSVMFPLGFIMGTVILWVLTPPQLSAWCRPIKAAFPWN